MTNAAPEREGPEGVLKRLSDGADPRRVRSLRVVHEVCEAQRAHGSRDYSLATIGKLVGARGGPSTAALGNPAGKAYRLLIASHRNACAAAAPRKARADDTDALLTGVRDPLQRARIEDLRNEVRTLRHRVVSLQRVANDAARVTIVRGDAGESDRVRVDSSAPAAPVLLPYEREALACALEPRRLKRLGLVVGANGRVESTDGHELFPLGFATGFQKLMLALAPNLPNG